jgi:hypothetical protein
MPANGTSVSSGGAVLAGGSIGVIVGTPSRGPFAKQMELLQTFADQA